MDSYSHFIQNVKEKIQEMNSLYIAFRSFHIMYEKNMNFNVQTNTYFCFYNKYATNEKLILFKFVTHLIPYTMGLYTALALAKSEHQMVANGVIFELPKIPMKFVTK